MWIKRVARLLRLLVHANRRTPSRAKVVEGSRTNHCELHRKFQHSKSSSKRLVVAAVEPRMVLPSSTSETFDGSMAQELLQYRFLSSWKLVFVFHQKLLLGFRAMLLKSSVNQMLTSAFVRTTSIGFDDRCTQVDCYSPEHNHCCSPCQYNPSNNTEHSLSSRQIDDYQLQIHRIKHQSRLTGLKSDRSSAGNLVANENMLSEPQTSVIPIGHTLLAHRDTLTRSINSGPICQNWGILVQQTGSNLLQHPTTDTEQTTGYQTRHTQPRPQITYAPDTNPMTVHTAQMGPSVYNEFASNRKDVLSPIMSANNAERPHVIQMTHTIAVNCLAPGQNDSGTIRTPLAQPPSCCPCANQAPEVECGKGVISSYVDRCCQTSRVVSDRSYLEDDTHSVLSTVQADLSASSVIPSPYNARDTGRVKLVQSTFATEPEQSEHHRISKPSRDIGPTLYKTPQQNSPNTADCCEICCPCSARVQEPGHETRTVTETNSQSTIGCCHPKTHPRRVSQVESVSQSEVVSRDIHSERSVTNSPVCCGGKKAKVTHASQASPEFEVEEVIVKERTQQHKKYLPTSRGSEYYPAEESSPKVEKMDATTKHVGEVAHTGKEAADVEEIEEERPCYFCFRRRRRSRVVHAEPETDTVRSVNEVDRSLTITEPRQSQTVKMFSTAQGEPTARSCRCQEMKTPLANYSKRSPDEVYQELSVPTWEVSRQSSEEEMDTKINKIGFLDGNGIPNAPDRRSVHSVTSNTARPIKTVRFESSVDSMGIGYVAGKSDKKGEPYYKQPATCEAKQLQLNQVGSASIHHSASCASDTACSKISILPESTTKRPLDDEFPSGPLDPTNYYMTVDRSSIPTQPSGAIGTVSSFVQLSPPRGQPDYGDQDPNYATTETNMECQKINQTHDYRDEYENEAAAEYVDTVQTISEANQMHPFEQGADPLVDVLHRSCCGCCVCCSHLLHPTCVHIRHVPVWCSHVLSGLCPCSCQLQVAAIKSTCNVHECMHNVTMKQTSQNAFALNSLCPSSVPIMNEKFRYPISCVPAYTY